MKGKEQPRPVPPRPELLPAKKEQEQKPTEQPAKKEIAENVAISVDFTRLKKAHDELRREAEATEQRGYALRRKAETLKRWIDCADRLWDFQRLESEAMQALEGQPVAIPNQYDSPGNADWPGDEDDEPPL